MSTKILAIALLTAVAFVAPALAGDDQVTVTGTIKCAKCVLNKADATNCQDVLVATDSAEYYLVKNSVAEKFGHGCKTEKAAVVTGKVIDKDGRKWIEASKIETPNKG
jgi:uncharacterized protein DUF6370